MSAHPSVPPPRPESSPGAFTVADASLHDVARELTSRFADGDVEPSLVRVRTTDSGLEVGLRALDGTHPSMWLTGYTADDDTDAIGTVTGGRAFPVGDPSSTLGRVVVTVVVSRRGEVASASVDQDGELTTGIEGGLVVDLLKRAVAVPTDPPPCGPEVLFAASWLASIEQFIVVEERVPSWAEIVGLHPAVEVLGEKIDRGGLIGDDHRDHIDTVCRAFARVVTWKKLRRAVDRGNVTIPGLEPGMGAWFDDGSFARRLLVEGPPLRHLRRELSARLPARLWGRVEQTLDAIGIPLTCWPDPVDELGASA